MSSEGIAIVQGQVWSQTAEIDRLVLAERVCLRARHSVHHIRNHSILFEVREGAAYQDHPLLTESPVAGLMSRASRSTTRPVSPPPPSPCLLRKRRTSPCSPSKPDVGVSPSKKGTLAVTGGLPRQTAQSPSASCTRTPQTSRKLRADVSALSDWVEAIAGFAATPPR